MNIEQALNFGKQELNKNEIEDSLLKVRILLTDILKQSKEYLVINNTKELSSQEEKEFKEKIEKLKLGYPIQYITNKQFFRNCEFYVDKNVLIPQPDTEILVEEAIKILKEKTFQKNKINILDLCTGSGAIIVSLGKELEKISEKYNFYGTDISEKAIEIAQKNANSNNVNVKFYLGDLFESINVNEKFDLIVSNPPYIETDVIKTLSLEVQKEPIIALDGGITGLDFYKRIAKESKNFLTTKGYLILEIGYNQMEAVCSILKNENFKIVSKVKDYANNDRVIVANLMD
jgi:release factor glutamine methyltransferase